MRHKVAGRHLNRTSEHRLAMRRNLAASLFEHETISTTMEKAKDVKPFAEKLITLSKKGTLAARRRAISMLGNRDIIAEEDGRPVSRGTVVGKLFSELGPRYLDRPGGYTRIIRLSMKRLGDNGQLVLLQLIGADEPVKKEPRPERKGKAGKSTKASKPEQEAKEATEPVAQEAVSQEERTTEAGDQAAGGETSETETEEKKEQ